MAEEIALQSAHKLPEFFIDFRPRLLKLPDFKDKTTINIRYPLLPPYAFAHIHWDNESKELLYSVEEQVLNSAESEILKLIQLGLEDLINISFRYAAKANLILKYLEKNVQSILAEIGAKVSREAYLKIMYYIYRDFVGLNKIEPLMHDPYIEDIECNGVDTPVYIVHRKYQNLKSNVIYTEISQLTDFVEKLSQKNWAICQLCKTIA